MTQSKYDVMAAGHICLDIIPQFLNGNGSVRFDQMFKPGRLINTGQAAISTGGPVSNTGINMKTLGNRVAFCACVGDDLIGRIIIDILNRNGNAEGIKVLQDKASSYTVVIAPPGIDRIFLHNPGTNNFFSADDLDPKLIAQCRLFHFGYPPLMDSMFFNEGEELKKVFKTAKDTGVITSCDMSLPDPATPSGKAPWRKILKKILPYIDLFLPSIEETLYMLYPDKFIEMKKAHNDAELIDYIPASEYSKLADELISFGAKVVALKSGHRGFYVKTSPKDALKDIIPGAGIIDNWADRELWTPAFEVENFGSATGSGDSSIAGFLTAYRKGLSIEKTLKYAVCLGYQNVCVLDAVSGIKDWDTTTKMLSSNMPVKGFKIDSPRWKYDKSLALWTGPNDSTGN
jgi:sugar/nucleoside kinase (ribokinase family)